MFWVSLKDFTQIILNCTLLFMAGIVILHINVKGSHVCWCFFGNDKIVIFLEGSIIVLIAFKGSCKVIVGRQVKHLKFRFLGF